MRVRFTKMQGAGNDFVVLDATRSPFALDPAQLIKLGDRRFGVGADQILLVEPATAPGIDFNYRIFNSNGAEVEQCGNGARCLVRYLHDRGLTRKRSVRVQTLNTVLELQLADNGQVSVDMNRPVFDRARVPFAAAGLAPRREGDFELWPLQGAECAVLSMGNPHAVLRVADVDTAPVATLGPVIETDPHFPNQVNVGFLQVLSRSEVRLRVHERGAGETLACGTGACAAVVAGIRLGWLQGGSVRVHLRGGDLQVQWNPPTAGDGEPAEPVLMTGPAVSVFEGEIEL